MNFKETKITAEIFSVCRKKYKTICVVVIVLGNMVLVVRGEIKEDSLMFQKYQRVNKNFPVMNMVDVQYSYSSPLVISASPRGQNLSTKLSSQQCFSTAINLPLFVSKHLIIMNAFRYQYGVTQLSDMDICFDQNPGDKSELKFNKAYTDVLSLIYISKLCGKRIIFNLNATSYFSAHKYERTNESLSLFCELKRTDKSLLSVGLMATMDPLATTPVVPLVSYSYWLNHHVYLDCLIPSYCYVRQLYSNGSRLSIGMNLSGSRSFYHLDIPSVLPFIYQQNRFELAAIYEKNIFPGLNISSKLGWGINLKGKGYLLDTNAMYFSVAQKPSCNFNVKVTYNLVLKKLKR